MMQPLFSVLIANYNNTRFIEAALESVFRQTYTNWEVIIVDDGSNDNARDFYRTLSSNNRIHIYFNESNMGCGYTKRRCAELADGEICGFLDPDDALTEDALYDMVQAHSEHPNASLISSQFIYCDSELRSTAKWHRYQNLQKSYLESSTGIITHFATFKKMFYLQTSGINARYKRAVDQDLYLKLEEVGEIETISKHHYYYRIHINGLSTLDAATKAFQWDVVARYEACQRRNIDFDSICLIPPYYHEAQHYKQLAERLLSFPPFKLYLQIRTALKNHFK